MGEDIRLGAWLDGTLTVPRTSDHEQLIALRQRALLAPDEGWVCIATAMHEDHWFAFPPNDHRNFLHAFLSRESRLDFLGAPDPSTAGWEWSAGRAAPGGHP